MHLALAFIPGGFLLQEGPCAAHVTTTGGLLNLWAQFEHCRVGH